MLNKRLLIPAAIFYTLVLSTVSLINLGNLTAGTPKNSDKAFHFLAYCLLALVWYVVFKIGFKWPKTKSLVTSGIVSICFGILIECLQGGFTQSRQFDVLDIVANSTGVFLMLIILAFIKKTNYKKI
ncbi:VanZ family protein [Formosa haliotis]|uniref:VanZ family protein n=1 Tax=Formosa haliotis TaxID=1555194 RepID=UPI001F15D805|nr:VanZ family protein [Formosa haliotis]